MFWMDNTHWINSQFRICYRQPNLIIPIFRYLETLQYWIVPRFDHSLPLGPPLTSFFGWLFGIPVLLPIGSLLILLLCNGGRNLGRSGMWFLSRSIEICNVNVYRFPFKSRYLPSSSKRPIVKWFIIWFVTRMNASWEYSINSLGCWWLTGILHRISDILRVYRSR